MKRIRKICLALVLVLAVQTAAVSVLPVMQVQAAAKKGLVKKKIKKKKRYVYYKNGRLLKNAWKRIKVKGKKYRFYFGKDGAAYQAKKLFLNAYNVKLFRIGKKKYGFDSSAHAVAPGIYVDGSSKIYVFGKKGVYDDKKTNALRTALPKGKISADMYSTVIDKLGKPKKVTEGISCNKWNTVNSFTDVSLTDVSLIYEHFEVQLVRNDDTKEYRLINYYSI